MRHEFLDPISGRSVVLSLEREIGVEHPDCPHLATVHPELDAFFCGYCGWNGRISGAWFMDLLGAPP